jgi:hypothetical protein
MGTTEALRRSIEDTHDELVERFGAARAMAAAPDRPRQAYERVDGFLATTSMHLHAVDAVLVPVVRHRVTDGGALVHDYLHAVRLLEVVLAHVKGHEYGSVYERSFSWPSVWSDVGSAMSAQQRQEKVLCDRLTETLDDDELDRLTQRLRAAQQAAPSRPHPYSPHTGLLGLVTRKVMHTADRFWDTVEGRMVPEPVRARKRRPGRVGQYLLGDPRFDEEDERNP